MEISPPTNKILRTSWICKHSLPIIVGFDGVVRKKKKSHRQPVGKRIFQMNDGKVTTLKKVNVDEGVIISAWLEKYTMQKRISSPFYSSHSSS